MRISELSTESGVPIPTIKFYLREGLLPQGEQVSATRAEYDRSHLRRLRLIRALREVGRLPIATLRTIIEAVEDEETSLHDMLGTAHYALSPSLEPIPDDEDWHAARKMVDHLITDLGWERVRPDAPARSELAQTLVTLERLGMQATRDDLLPYARAADDLVKEHDIKKIDVDSPREKAIETLVICQVLYGKAFDVLRRLAQESESARVFGASSAPDHTPPPETPGA